MPEKQPYLEYNLAGGLGLTRWGWSLEQLCKGVNWAGYKYACVLPFGGLQKGVKPLASLSIVHFEEAWNPTDERFLIPAVTAGILGRRKLLKPNLYAKTKWWDGFLPPRVICQKLIEDIGKTLQPAKLIAHDIQPNLPPERWLLEVNPNAMGPKTNLSQIADWASESEVMLVFDPRHALYKSTVSLPDQPSRETVILEDNLNPIAQHVEVIDINPPKGQDVQLLLERKGILAELAQEARKMERVRFLRVELQIPNSAQIPFSPRQRRGFEFLKEIGEALRSA